MYAIVDIETTGSHAHSNGITEIAIVLHNGKEVEGRYSSLVNPGYPIPRFVAALTGITNDMVADAPDFSKIAETVYNHLEGRIFIAHNVNFDYSFVKYHLKEAGFEWNARKLCTVRLSRTAFPGLRKYGLDWALPGTKHIKRRATPCHRRCRSNSHFVRYDYPQQRHQTYQRVFKKRQSRTNSATQFTQRTRCGFALCSGHILLSRCQRKSNLCRQSQEH